MKNNLFGFIFIFFLLCFSLYFISDYNFAVVATDTINMDGEHIPLIIAIITEIFISVHMCFFALYPIAGIINKNKQMKIFVILFIIRLIILIIGDIISPVITMIVDFISTFVLGFMLVPILKYFKRTIFGDETAYYEYVEIEDHDLAAVGFSNRELLKQVVLEQYLDIKSAFSAFNYKRLIELCSKEQYLLYKNELKLLEQVNNKKFFDDFVIIDSKLYDAYKSNQGISVCLILKVSYFEYMLDDCDKVTYGSKKDKKEVILRLCFYKSLEHKYIDECPNCGSPITADGIEFCSYCGTELNFKVGEFVLRDEKVIEEK